MLGIFLVSLTLRILAITVPINSDEVLWMTRGSTFIQNLLEGDLTGTYRRHHPGVTNMWVIGSSMLANCRLQKHFPSLLGLNQPLDLDACFNQVQFPILFYVLPRLLQGAIASACMVCFYILAKQLLGQSVALCSLSLLLLEPFFLAYQRYLTTDALMADFSILALLLFLLYLRSDLLSASAPLRDRYRRRLLVASGVFMGLATATKVTALFILPAVALWIVLIESGIWRTRFPQRGWKRQLADLRWWGLSILGTIVLIWPAMWVSPSYVVAQIYKGLLKESARGVLFFLGQITDSPGLLFYPLVLAYRLSPVLQVGLLAFLAILLIPKLRRHQKKMPEVTALALIPLCVLLTLSVSDSKIDRYINLLLPVLALLSAVGWLEIVVWVGRGAEVLRRRFGKHHIGQWGINRGVTTAIALFGLQLIVLIPYYPYYLSYYNPLLGGSAAAKHIFMIGQGEGLDLAAKWLNQLPNAKEIKVASWYSSSFAAYFHGQTLPIEKDILPDPQPWTTANRVVLYYNQFQRQLPEPKAIAYFAPQQPLYAARLHDIDYARVYPGPVPLLEDLERIQVPLSLSFGKQVQLLGYDLNTSKLLPDEALVVTFYWKFLAPMPPDMTINISLRDTQGNLQNRSDARPLDGYFFTDQVTSGTVLRDVHKLTVTPGTPPNRYRLEVGWYSPSNGQALEVRDAVGNSPGTQAIIGEVEVIRSDT
ncbi:glycosyltransferase family 39 protein [Coleofasciculus sp. FACHB-T130]|uniref:glycosyltransferase family 39 protein n=1 Tax=Cyanophyceae TaxID=3028117 RepID=UPI0018EF702E|nr:glycosyltransferase family 39 protein [Coleofasciculus sp. FACHB-T130]